MSRPARLFTYYSYAQAQAAIDWLVRAFGFATVRQQNGVDGKVQHAELRLGDVVIMLASNDADYVIPPLKGRSTGHGAYILVDDVEALYARAMAAGATPVFGLEETEWGTKRFRVLDSEGYEWSFGTYEPGASWE